MSSSPPARTDSPSYPDAQRSTCDEAPNPAPPDPLLGRVIDERYRLLSLLGRGGMGRVYRAEEAVLERHVAIKILDTKTHDDAEFRGRFVREAEISARLTHPNTVRILNNGGAGSEVLYIVMELLEGRTLYQTLQTDAPMDALRVTRIGQQVAGSLGEAHSLGLIHRDLKASNVILQRSPEGGEWVKVLDFGLAREMLDGVSGDAFVGSPSYMSPEQIRSKPLDQRSDIYSLGVLLYACMCGRPPFSGASPLEILHGHLHHPPPRMHDVCPSMKRARRLESVILRCLSKEPRARYSDMGTLFDALVSVEASLR